MPFVKRLLSKPLALTPVQLRLFKAGLHALFLGYLIFLGWAAVTDNLGADPVKALIHSTGTSALNLLLLTLLITPLAKHLPFPSLMQCRRLIGIYVFVYALLHLTSYVSFELQFDWALIASEVIERPYITVGFIALLDLMLLTITSPMWVRRKMKRNWQRLHNSIYLIALLALVHFSWSRKTALQEPLIYWFIALVIMLPRFNFWFKQFKRHV